MSGLIRSVRVLGMLVCGVIATLAGCQQQQAKEADPAAVTSGSNAVPSAVVTVDAVQVRTVQRKISVVGTLYGFEEFTVTPKVEGRVLSIHADVSDRVEPGALLLELDPTDYELAVNEAQRAVELELAKLGLTELPNDDFDIEQLPSVARSRLLTENAQQKFDRMKRLMATSASTREVFEQAESDYKVAAATLQQTRLEVKATFAAIKHRAAILAQAKQKLAETRVSVPRLPMMMSTSLANSPPVPTELAVSRRLVAVGDIVRAFPSTPVFHLVMDSTLRLRAKVPERYAAEVQSGQVIELRIEAYPTEVFTAHITRINPTIDLQSRTFEIEAHVVNADRRLKAGGFAKADILTATKNDALTARLESLVSFAGVNKVFAVRDGKVQAIEVSIGVRGRGWVELLGEVRADDSLVTSGHSQLIDGASVRVREDAP